MSADEPTPTDTHRVRRVYALAPASFPHDAPWNDYAARQFDNWLAAHDAELLAPQAAQLLKWQSGMLRMQRERDEARAQIAEALAAISGTPRDDQELRLFMALRTVLSRVPQGAAEPTNAERYPAMLAKGGAWEFAADRRVAPDPEKVAREMCRIYCGPDAWDEGENGNPHDPENWHDNTAHRREAAALLASGVLGIPADPKGGIR